MKKRIGAALLSFAMLAALFVPSVIPARAEADNAITPVLTTTPEPTATVTAAPGETAAPTTTVTTAPGETAAPSAQPTETAAPSASPETSESPAPSATPAQCTCGAAEGEAHKEGCPLYAKPFDASSVYDSLMACATADEMDAILAALTEEQLAQFTDEQKAALEEHYQSLKGEEEPGEEGLPIISYTDVGPLLAAPAMPRLLRARALVDDTTDNSNGNGVVLNKKAEKQGESSYKITMEAYATGASTTTVSTEPVDIVLVLDVSGSMEDRNPVYESDLKKDKTYYINAGILGYVAVTWNEKDQEWRSQYLSYTPKKNANDSSGGRSQFYDYQTKLESLKNAVYGFVDSVAEKSPDSSIAIVKFADDSYYNTQNKLQEGNHRNNLDYNYTEVLKNFKGAKKGATELKEAVGGLNPGGATASDYGMNLAKELLNQEQYKDDGRKKVVIMFTDGEPNHSNGFNKNVANNAIAASKSIKDTGATVYTIGIFSGADGTPVTDDRAWGKLSNVNKYMHLVSSNYKNAASMDNPGVATYPAGGKSYFLSAGSADELNSIFQQISQEVGGSTTTLDGNAVIKDIVTPYFTMPANAENVTVKTAESDGSTERWKDAETFNGKVTINQEDNSVSVSGFSFKDNWCGTHTENGATSFRNGKKLIIEFEVKVKDGFLGGNNVPTNGEQSGIYENSSAGEPIQTFDVPTVNVPIPDITITAEDKNVYLLQTPNSDTMKKWVTKIECGTVNISAPDQIEPWQKEYVTIGELTVAADNGFDATADGTYTARLTVSPKTGEGAKTGTVTKQINVFKPELTFKDSQIDLGETANYENNKADTNFEVWKHGESTDEGVNMIGTKPGLALSYDPEAVAFKQDTPVKVTVKIGDTVVNEYTKFNHADDCTFDGCKWGKDGFEDCHFIVHVKSFDLTIQKEGWEEIDENQSFVFEVKKDDGSFSMDVVIHGNESVTIKGLKPGTYTVTEETGWSWRYTLAGVSQQVNPATAKEKDENGAVLVTFTNTREKIKWLNGGAWCENRWATKTATKPTDNN